MDFLKTIFVLIIAITLTIFILHKILQSRTSKFASFINGIWNEWFEDQWNAIIVFIVFLVITILIGFIIK